MNFNFSEEQILLRNLVQDVVRDSYSFEQRTKIVRSDEGISRENWKKFAALGLLGAPLSTEQGGLGGGAIDAMIVMEELGRGLVVEPYLQTVILCAGLLERCGSASQKEAFLPKITDGSALWVLAYGEADSRSQPAHIRLNAKRDGDKFILNGHKSVVGSAPCADYMIVAARTSGALDDMKGISLFIVERKADGVSLQDYEIVDGSRAADVHFENVAVQADMVLGEIDGGYEALDEALDYGAAALCAEALGIMRVATQATIDYARTRQQFDQPIGQFQVLQHRMVDMVGEVEHGTSMTYMANMKLAASVSVEERRRAVSAAKSYMAKAGRMIGQNGVHIHGGMGLTAELNIGHYFKRLTVIHFLCGDEDYHLKRFAMLANNEQTQAA